jgi:eukaryotic-like serine/threonine-protein kinase
MEVRVSDPTPPAWNTSENQESESENNSTRSIEQDATIGAVPEFAASHSAVQPAPPPRRCIGNYELVRKLGEGGMGQVWLAEQTAPIRREVALKLIKAGVCDESRLHRFQSERQYLALMDHPCIAKVFDAGTTPDGQPYLVMERIAGLPITEYCDLKKLKIPERLELFTKVCDGVQHAHQKAIIHRDLKPGNILVIQVDGQPAPRIIDFGLAKAVRTSIDRETVESLFGDLAGTPGYLSPEQIDASAGDIDTRADVYSLGVVLYVLLTGALPFDPKEWRNKPLEFVLRQLREEDPPRPSARIAMQNGSANSVASLRAAKPKQLAHFLHGDLDCITMKALEKDRARRYGTPSELAADIGRFLHHDAVLARPAGRGYRLQKYIRRHRIGVAVAGGLVLMLGGFAVTQAEQVRRITRERDRANRITDFMTNMFKVSDPSAARGNTITAREILDRASKEIDTGLAKDPQLQAQMMGVMGVVYDHLGLYPQAQQLLDRALQIQRVMIGTSDEATLQSMDELGNVLAEQARYVEAEKLDIQTLEARRRVLGPEHRETLRSMDSLATVLAREARYTDAEKLEQQTLDFRRRLLGPEDRDTIISMNNLAGLLADEGRYLEAESLQRETLQIKRHTIGPDDPDTLISMYNLAITIKEQGRYPEAEKLQRETLDIERRVLGLEHPLTLKTMNNLAATLLSEGQDGEAEDTLHQLRDIDLRVFGRDHPSTAVCTYNLAIVAAHKGNRDEAFSLLMDAIDHGLPLAADLAVDKDDDLKSLHGDPRFDALVAYAKTRVAAAQKAN